MWGEPDRFPETEGVVSTGLSQTLWHASVKGVQVTAQPRAIVSADQILWNHETVTLGLDHAQPYAVLRVRSADGDLKTILLRNSGSEWAVDDAVVLPRGIATSAVFADTVQLLAYITSSPNLGNNTLVVAERHGSAITVQPITHATDSGRIVEARLIGNPNGEIHLLWATGESAFGMTRLFHSRFSDGAWSQPDSTSLTSPTFRWDGVVDRCGSVHVLVLAWGESGLPRLEYLRWQERWLNSTSPPITEIASELVVGLTMTGEPLAVWNTVLAERSEHKGYVATVYSVLHSH